MERIVDPSVFGSVQVYTRKKRAKASTQQVRKAFGTVSIQNNAARSQGQKKRQVKKRPTKRKPKQAKLSPEEEAAWEQLKERLCKRFEEDLQHSIKVVHEHALKQKEHMKKGIDTNEVATPSQVNIRDLVDAGISPWLQLPAPARSRLRNASEPRQSLLAEAEGEQAMFADMGPGGFDAPYDDDAVYAADENVEPQEQQPADVAEPTNLEEQAAGASAPVEETMDSYDGSILALVMSELSPQRTVVAAAASTLAATTPEQSATGRRVRRSARGRGQRNSAGAPSAATPATQVEEVAESVQQTEGEVQEEGIAPAYTPLMEPEPTRRSKRRRGRNACAETAEAEATEETAPSPAEIEEALVAAEQQESYPVSSEAAQPTRRSRRRRGANAGAEAEPAEEETHVEEPATLVEAEEVVATETEAISEEVVQTAVKPKRARRRGRKGKKKARNAATKQPATKATAETVDTSAGEDTTVVEEQAPLRRSARRRSPEQASDAASEAIATNVEESEECSHDVTINDTQANIIEMVGQELAAMEEMEDTDQRALEAAQEEMNEQEVEAETASHYIEEESLQMDDTQANILQVVQQELLDLQADDTQANILQVVAQELARAQRTPAPSPRSSFSGDDTQANILQVVAQELARSQEGGRFSMASVGSTRDFISMEDTQANILEVVAKELAQRQREEEPKQAPRRSTRRTSTRESITADDTQANILQIVAQELTQAHTQAAHPEEEEEEDPCDSTSANILQVVAQELAKAQAREEASATEEDEESDPYENTQANIMAVVAAELAKAQSERQPVRKSFRSTTSPRNSFTATADDTQANILEVVAQELRKANAAPAPASSSADDTQANILEIVSQELARAQQSTATPRESFSADDTQANILQIVTQERARQQPQRRSARKASLRQSVSADDTQANILQVVAQELARAQRTPAPSPRPSFSADDTQANILQVVAQELARSQERGRSSMARDSSSMEDTQANILEVVAKELAQRQHARKSSLRHSMDDTQANILQVIAQELASAQQASPARQSVDDTQANILEVVARELAARKQSCAAPPTGGIGRVSVGNVPPEGFVCFDVEEDEDDMESSETEEITRNHTIVLEPKLLEAIQETLRSPAGDRSEEEQDSCWLEEGEEELADQDEFESDSHFLNDEDEYEEEDCDDTIVRLSKFIELPAWSEAFRQSLTPLRDTIQRRFSEVSDESGHDNGLAGEETRMMVALSQDPSFREMMVKNQQALLTKEAAEEQEEEEEEEEEDFSKMTVSQLRVRCKQVGLSTGGKKASLVQRLKGHREAERALAQSHTPTEDGVYVYGEESAPEQGTALEDLLQQLAEASPSALAATGVASTLRELLTRI